MITGLVAHGMHLATYVVTVVIVAVLILCLEYYSHLFEVCVIKLSLTNISYLTYTFITIIMKTQGT